LMATIVVGGLLLTAAAGGAAAAAGGASAYLYRRKQKKKAKKKKAQKEQVVFGQHLEEVTSLSENDLPKVFDFTICWLGDNGLAVDNLFSFTRSPIRAGELAHSFDTGCDDEPDFSTEDPRDVALLLIRYLGDLPEPLCTFVLYDDFIQIEEEDNVENWIEAMRSQLLQLPDINLRVVKRLMKFLQLYCREQQRVCQVPTERTVDTLSKIFGRLLFNTWDETGGDFEDCVVSQSLFAKFLVNYDRIFSSQDSLQMFSPLETMSAPSATMHRGEIPKEFSSEKIERSQGICLDKTENDDRAVSRGICLDKEPENGSVDSPGKKKRKRKKKKKQQEAAVKEEDEDSCYLDLDTMSSPELEIMCNEVRSQVGAINLEKTEDPYASYRKSSSFSKPLPKPPV